MVVYSMERGEVTVDSSRVEEGKDMVDPSIQEREEYVVVVYSMERGEVTVDSSRVEEGNGMVD